MLPIHVCYMYIKAITFSTLFSMGQLSSESMLLSVSDEKNCSQPTPLGFCDSNCVFFATLRAAKIFCLCAEESKCSDEFYKFSLLYRYWSEWCTFTCMGGEPAHWITKFDCVVFFFFTIFSSFSFFVLHHLLRLACYCLTLLQ